MISTATKLGVAGIVGDGCVRDSQKIRKSGLPVYRVGLSTNGPFKEGPGEINFPLSCGGQVVRPGYFIIADDDGVVVLRQEIANQVIDKVHAIIVREENRLKKISCGDAIRKGIDEISGKKGVVA